MLLTGKLSLENRKNFGTRLERKEIIEIQYQKAKFIDYHSFLACKIEA